MSIHDRLQAVLQDLHLTGFGSELTQGLQRISALFADELHSLSPNGTRIETEVATKLEQLVKDELARLQPGLEEVVSARVALMTGEIQKLIGSLQESVDDRVKTLFEQLLAKAAAAEAPKAAPDAPTPLADALKPAPDATEQSSDAPKSENTQPEAAAAV